MKDVIKSGEEKAQIKVMHGRNVKVDRRHRRHNMNGYYAVAIIFAVLVMIILCMTCFFNYNADSVIINGVTLYDRNQIFVVGGIPNKGNLIRTDTKKIEERLANNLVYIDSVSVEKKFPSSLEINIKEAQKAADIEFEGKYYVLSDSGKILEAGNENRNKNIPLIKVKGLKSIKAGENVETNDVLTTKVLLEFMSNIKELDFKKITQIDLTDRAEIKFVYNNNINVTVGSSLDLDYKLKYLKVVITEKLGDNYKGTVIYNSAESGISAIPESTDSKVAG
ncbi:MAG: cell division protein FtsQ/DivIB [Oscillospiraceae bacterium]